MATYTLDSTKVGTSLTTVAGTMSGMTVAAVPTINDKDTLICLTDGPGGRTLWAATLLALIYLFEPRPGFALTPGTTAPTFPRSLIVGSIAVAKGLYVQSCPAGVSITVTA